MTPAQVGAIVAVRNGRSRRAADTETGTAADLVALAGMTLG